MVWLCSHSCLKHSLQSLVQIFDLSILLWALSCGPGLVHRKEHVHLLEDSRFKIDSLVIMYTVWYCGCTGCGCVIGEHEGPSPWWHLGFCDNASAVFHMKLVLLELLGPLAPGAPWRTSTTSVSGGQFEVDTFTLKGNSGSDPCKSRLPTFPALWCSSFRRVHSRNDYCKY